MSDLDAFDEFEIDEGDDKVESRQSKFLADPNKTQIVSMAWIREIMNDDFDPRNVDSHNGPKFIKANNVFIDKVGKIIVTKDPEIRKIASDAPNDVRQRVLTMVVVWPTKMSDDNKLGIDMNAILAGKYQVKPWEFAPEKYQIIKDQGSEESLLKCDLKVTLPGKKDPKYQDFNVTRRGKSVLRSIFESSKVTDELINKIVDDIREEITKSIDKKSGILGQHGITASEIRKKMRGGDSEGGSSTEGIDESAEDIDDMLGDL